MRSRAREFEVRCDMYRLAVAAMLDGEAADLPRGDMERHLAGCVECREYRADLLELRHELAGMPSMVFPSSAVDALLAQTVDAAEPSTARRGRVPLLVGLSAIAAALALAVIAPRLAPTLTDAHSTAEVRRAASETLFVLGLASDAVNRAETVALQDVLDARVSPALKRVSDGWMRISTPTLRRLGT